MSDAAHHGAQPVRPIWTGWRRGLVSLLGAILLWELTARLLSGAFLLAGPVEVAGYIQANSGLLARAMRVTLAEAAAGFLIGNLAAVALALLAFAVPRFERLIAALALLVFCLPLVATGPLLRVVFGPGAGPQVTLAALAVYYTTFVPLLVGLRAAPASWFDIVRSYGRGRVTELLQIRLFAALPYLFAGLQIAAPAAFLGAMVGEFTGAERGMGVLAIRAMQSLDVPATWALAVLAAAVSTAVYAFVGWLGAVLLRDPPPLLLAPPALPDRRSQARRWRSTLAESVPIVLSAIALWQLAIIGLGLNPFFAKGPADIWTFLLTGPDASTARQTLFGALAETVRLVVPGYLAGLALGAGTAALILLRPRLAGIAMPLAVTLRSVPIVTTAPLVILLLGRGATGTITMVAMMIFFPTLVACLHGLRQAPGQVIDVFESYAAGPIQRLLHAQVPAMLPAFFAAARMSVPAAVLAVTVVEWLATGAGIGSLMAISASLSDYNMLWSTIVTVALLSCAGYVGIAAVERRVLARYASEQLR